MEGDDTCTSLVSIQFEEFLSDILELILWRLLLVHRLLSKSHNHRSMLGCSMLKVNRKFEQHPRSFLGLKSRQEMIISDLSSPFVLLT